MLSHISEQLTARVRPYKFNKLLAMNAPSGQTWKVIIIFAQKIKFAIIYRILQRK